MASPSPSQSRSSARSLVYSHFTQGGVAYSVGDKDYYRYYCSACLEREMDAARLDGRAARSRHRNSRARAGQTTDDINAQEERDENADEDNANRQLAQMAMGRMPFLTRNWRHMSLHLLDACTSISNATKSSIKEARSVLLTNQSNFDVYHNPFDRGSILEALNDLSGDTTKRKRKRLDDLIPGKYSPARVFAQHEEQVLKAAESKAERRLARKKRRQELQNRIRKDNNRRRTADFELVDSSSSSGEENGVKDAIDSKISHRHKSGNQDQVGEGEQVEEEEEEDEEEEEEFEENQMGQYVRDNRKALQANLDLRDKRFDKTMLSLDPEVADLEDCTPPEDFPSSDLLRSLITHTSSLYSSRGLLSTLSHPTDPTTNQSLPSMLQSLDGSALIALGILTQELLNHNLGIITYATREQETARKGITTTTARVQPVSDLYERKIYRRGWATGRSAGSARAREKELDVRILQALMAATTATATATATATTSYESSSNRDFSARSPLPLPLDTDTAPTLGIKDVRDAMKLGVENAIAKRDAELEAQARAQQAADLSTHAMLTAKKDAIPDLGADMDSIQTRNRNPTEVAGWNMDGSGFDELRKSRDDEISKK